MSATEDLQNLPGNKQDFRKQLMEYFVPAAIWNRLFEEYVAPQQNQK
jgi:hypothetical protein